MTNISQAKKTFIIANQIFRFLRFMGQGYTIDNGYLAAGYNLFSLFLLQGLWQQYKSNNRCITNIPHEINSTRNSPQFFNSVKNWYRVYSNQDIPEEWGYVPNYLNANQDIFYLNANQETVYWCAKKMSQVRLKLSHIKDSADAKYIGTLPSIPSYFNSQFNWIMPYFSAGMDAPSKGRTLDLVNFIITLLFVSYSAYFLSHLDMECLNLLFFYMFIAILSCFESSFLREQEFRLNLQGIQQRVTSYTAFPPTCFGQQLTAQHLFVGGNSNLDNTIAFIDRMSYFIKKNEIKLKKLEFWPEIDAVTKEVEELLFKARYTSMSQDNTSKSDAHLFTENSWLPV
jgi:hypothetical protein